ncbi:MAG: extracellular solute-binding protein [Acuticoccus sp.]
MRAKILAAAALVWLAAPTFAHAQSEPEWEHASSLSGEPRYPADFPHFNYVNPDAPKGGRVRLADPSGYDSFNPILQRGNPAPGIGVIYDTLMTSSFDEIDISTMYGQIAEALRHPDDFSWVEYRIDPDARWHDGTPVTPEDVVWSLDVTKAADPTRAFYYKDVVKAEDVGDNVVRFTFSRPGNKELPHIVGQLMVLPKHWWTGTDASGNPRDIMSGTLEPPLGSGPYRVGRFEPNRYVEYQRVPDYWAADKPFNIGKNNFDAIHYETYRDQTVLLEAFKGDRYDFRLENSAKNWATGYDFPARERGDVILEEFPDEARGVMQAFFMNLRLPKFQDPRVRRALNLLYDFEAQKETIFYGQYERISSYFHGTALAATGVPEGLELEILEEVRDQVPPAVFTEPYTNPVNGTAQNVRANQREAVRLFREAGYVIRDGKMVKAETGEPFTIELIENQATMDRVVLPFKASLARLGIDLSFRVVDTSQLLNRLRNFDYEMTIAGIAQSLSPGNEQLDYWGSEAADRPQSQNYAGIKNEAVDHLIERVITAPDRETLIAATRALDRVLLHNNYVIPQFSSGTLRTARWNRFGHPDNIPPYTTGFPTIWWWDAQKADSIGQKS